MKNENVYKNPAAVALGSIKTAKKASSSRENGKKGGRPMKLFDLYINNTPQGKDVMAATPQSAARKLGMDEYFMQNGRIWWDENGDHFEVIPEERW